MSTFTLGKVSKRVVLLFTKLRQFSGTMIQKLLVKNVLCKSHEIKYSRIDQVKFVEDSL